MPNFNREILHDTHHRSLVKFIQSVTGPIAIGQLTGGISPLDLTGYSYSATGPNTGVGRGITDLDIRVSRLFWSMPVSATGNQGYELSWGMSGSATGQPFFYMHNTSEFHPAEHGLILKNTTTGPTRDSSIMLRNTQPLVAGDTVTVYLELDKNRGFSLTMMP